MDHHKEIKILLAIICSGILVISCSCGISALSGKITIRELCGYNESDTPLELHYSYMDDSSESTIEVTVEDEAIIKQTLAAILDTKVNNRGLQVDMYVYKSAAYEYVYADHTIRFSFIPYSYFSFDGEYYEISESEVQSLSDLFDDAEM